MESITSTTSTYDQNCVIIPSEIGIGGILRITGDPGVMDDMYRQAKQEQRQAVLEAPGRVLGAVAGYLGNVANNIASGVKLEAKMATFDLLHGTQYRQARHELLEQQARERFLASLGLREAKR